MDNTPPSTIILADGSFPSHIIPLGLLNEADKIICCDGSVSKLLHYGKTPYAIVGDLDSLSTQLKKQFASITYHFPSQEDNDLTKTVNFCTEKGFDNIAILGATGEREDHTIGNIFLLPLYARKRTIRMYTDYGWFEVLTHSGKLKSFQGQQISIFCNDPRLKINTSGLRYPIKNTPLSMLWMGTLNETLGDSFSISFDQGSVIVFFQYPVQKQKA